MLVKDFLCPKVARSMEEDSSDLQSAGGQVRDLFLIGGTFVDAFISGAFFFWCVILPGLLGAEWKDLAFYSVISLILLLPTMISFVQYPKLRLKIGVWAFLAFAIIAILSIFL